MRSDNAAVTRPQTSASAAALATSIDPRFQALRSKRGLFAAMGVLTVLTLYAGLIISAGERAAVLPMVAVFLCAILSGIVGFAFSALGQPALAVLMSSPVHIVQTLMLCSLANQFFSIAALWRHMQWRRLPPFLVGGVLGLPVGVYVLLNLPIRDFHIAVGTILLVYGAYVIVKRPIVLPDMGKLPDAAFGFLGGMAGGLAALPGVPVTIWCNMRGWDKAQQRGVFQPFILFMQIGGLILVTLLSAHRLEAGAQGAIGLLAALAILPGSLAGTWVGLHIFHRISDRGFELCFAALLLFAGAALWV